ncbi:hypothetical protein Fmac_021597 [Flemingia macrophylla]|uniref:GDSL esterase/lipase n=1 Tax=Flemingia macrophylla TaxID=520843 RepID=A0ABD1LXB4_9FABA
MDNSAEIGEPRQESRESTLGDLQYKKWFFGQALHDDVGARKFVLVGVGLIGCTPNAISTHMTNGTCVDEVNKAAFMFNTKLKSLVDQFNNKFSTDSKFIFTNSTARSLDSSLETTHPHGIDDDSDTASPFYNVAFCVGSMRRAP